MTPGWAISVERDRDGRTISRDERGEPLVALAVTRAEVTLLESGLRLLPQEDRTAALLYRLALLHTDLDEATGQGHLPSLE